jgi:hypothetical protein
MPEFQVRRDVVGSRREGRRSLSAYNATARGVRHGGHAGHVRRASESQRQASPPAGDFNAGVALALVFPLMQGARSADRDAERSVTVTTPGDQGASMKRKPSIKSLENVSLDEAMAYLDHAGGDELDAAYALAIDRTRLDGSHGAPDDAEVHHALFLLCRARGKNPPSFDEMRVELRRRIAA